LDFQSPLSVCILLASLNSANCPPSQHAGEATTGEGKPSFLKYQNSCGPIAYRLSRQRAIPNNAKELIAT
jgi:hypothetical protein